MKFLKFQKALKKAFELGKKMNTLLFSRHWFYYEFRSYTKLFEFVYGFKYIVFNNDFLSSIYIISTGNHVFDPYV